MSDTLMIPSIISVVIFLVVMLFAVFFDRTRNMQERVRRIATPAAGGDMHNDPVIDSLYNEEKSSGLAAVLERLLSLVGVNMVKFRKTSQMRFYRAGISSSDAPIYFMAFKRFGVVIFLFLAYAMYKLPGAGSMRLVHIMCALIFIVLGLFGPELFLSNQEAKRKKLLLRSFPDALDLLLVCVESGLALDGALARVCKELGRAYPEIADELNRTRLELTLLNDRSQALTNLADRTDMLCFRALTTTLLQSEKFGTSLTDTLRVLSEDYRNTRLMLAEEKAGRLPVLMTVPLIVLMMPALFLIILGPTIIRYMDVPGGAM
jgi:tight adherence protein C